MRKKVGAALRAKVFGIAKGICEYCQSDSDFSGSPFDVEHIIPVVKNGPSNLENLALACQGCNLHKSLKAKGYDELRMNWSSYFIPVAINGTITSSGRTTEPGLWVNFHGSGYRGCTQT